MTHYQSRNRNRFETAVQDRGREGLNENLNGICLLPWIQQGSIHDSTFSNPKVEVKEIKFESQTSESIDSESSKDCENNEFGKEHSAVSTEKPEHCEKKKTPMCLVNELARYHKIQPQYRLTEESGPAHQKIFFISLELGNEHYTASGQSIKKAQHAAAQLALQETSFRLPEPRAKVKHAGNSHHDKPITPTVELNAVAMKLNFPPVYTTLAPIPCPNKINDSLVYQNNTRPSEPSPLCKSDFRLNQVDPNGRFLNADFQPPYSRSFHRFPSGFNQRYYINRLNTTPMTHRVTLSVGTVFVTGEGPSPQAARHHAAQQALEELRKEFPFNKPPINEATVITEADTDTNLKSPVSLAHELALKLNQNVEFTVLSESGPPHMKNFVVQCKLGDVTTQGEGNCKKLAKKKSAEIMLDELKKIHPHGIFRTNEEVSTSISQRPRIKTKPTLTRKKPRNLVKDVTSASNGNLGTKPQDPISQLVQLQQARKEKEPVFTVVSERGIPRQSPEFVVEVSVGSVTATGVGAKKKGAKRSAALKALEILGAVTKCSIEEKETSLFDTEQPSLDTTNSGARQVIPGLLLIEVNLGGKEDLPVKSNLLQTETNKESPQIAQTSKSSGGLRPETRLRYLAQVLEYEVEFSDFPKGKKGDFVTLVTLSTIPPQVCHGLGATLEEAHDNAASNMLKLIAGGALDDKVTKDKENTGDGSSDKH